MSYHPNTPLPKHHFRWEGRRRNNEEALGEKMCFGIFRVISTGFTASLLRIFSIECEEVDLQKPCGREVAT
jgi:hypothetical protein